METNLKSLFNKPALAGLALAVFPILFWIAVISQAAFNHDGLISKIIREVDNASPVFSFLLCLVLPFIALLINLFHTTGMRMFSQEKEHIAVFSFRRMPVNFSIIIFCGLNILLLVAYLFTENYMLIRI